MAYTLPNHPGVTVYASPAEAMAAGKIDKVEQGNDGNLYATPHQGWLLRNMPWLVMGAMAAGAGAYALGAGGGAAPTAASGVLPSSSLPVSSLMGGPAAIASQGVSGLTAAQITQLLARGSAGPVVDAAGGGAGSVLGKLKSLLTSQGGLKDAAGLAALLPLLKSGGGSTSGTGAGTATLPTDNPFADLALPPAQTYAGAPAEARDAYALQKRRVDQTQPAFDALVNQAYGMTPTRYRGAPPEGMPAAAQAPVSGAYAYRGPQFG